MHQKKPPSHWVVERTQKLKTYLLKQPEEIPSKIHLYVFFKREKDPPPSNKTKHPDQTTKPWHTCRVASSWSFTASILESRNKICAYCPMGWEGDGFSALVRKIIQTRKNQHWTCEKRGIKRKGSSSGPIIVLFRSHYFFRGELLVFAGVKL